MSQLDRTALIGQPFGFGCCKHCEHDPGYAHQVPCVEGCNGDVGEIMSRLHTGPVHMLMPDKSNRCGQSSANSLGAPATADPEYVTCVDCLEQMKVTAARGAGVGGGLNRGAGDSSGPGWVCGRGAARGVRVEEPEAADDAS